MTSYESDKVEPVTEENGSITSQDEKVDIPEETNSIAGENVNEGLLFDYLYLWFLNSCYYFNLFYIN